MQEFAPLLAPNVIICSVGTEVFWRGADGVMRPDPQWQRHLGKGWNREAITKVMAPRIAEGGEFVQQVRARVCDFVCCYTLWGVGNISTIL